jgi:hypothetical protein
MTMVGWVAGLLGGVQVSRIKRAWAAHQQRKAFKQQLELRSYPPRPEHDTTATRCDTTHHACMWMQGALQRPLRVLPRNERTI